MEYLLEITLNIDENFYIEWNNIERKAWKSFKDVVHGVLGNNKAQGLFLLLNLLYIKSFCTKYFVEP